MGGTILAIVVLCWVLGGRCDGEQDADMVIGKDMDSDSDSSRSSRVMVM